MKINIDELQERVRQFTKERGWDDFHNPKNLAMSISIESAELMEIFQWLTNDEAKAINQPDKLEHIGEEIADVIIYCLSLCNQFDLDATDVIIDKMNKNANRFPKI